MFTESTDTSASRFDGRSSGRELRAARGLCPPAVDETISPGPSFPKL